MSLKKVNFSDFLPLHVSKNYNLPTVTAHCFQSKLFHSKMISNMIAGHLNRLAFDKNQEESRIPDQTKSSRLTLPKIHAFITKDKLSIYTDLSINSLSMRGYKEITKGDSLKEHIASAVAQLSGVSREGGPKVVWDPFCGCGTILIEAYMIKSKKQLRKISSFLHLLDYKFFYENEEAKNLLLQKIKEEKGNKQVSVQSQAKCLEETKFIGSDISSYALKGSIENCKSAKIHYNTQDLKNAIAENPFVFREKINGNLEFLLGDYEKVFPLIYNQCSASQPKVSIVSHIPYLVNKDQEKTRLLYKQFGKFLRKNFDSFESVALLVKSREKKDGLNFQTLSELRWDILHEFNNEGTEVQLIKLKQ